MTNDSVFKPAMTLDFIKKLSNGNDLSSLLDMEFFEMTGASISARIQISQKHTRPGGIMSGGTTLALIETVGSVAGLSTIDYKTHDIFGIEVNANHVRQVKIGETIVAKAEYEHIGRTTQIWNVKITCDSKLVCTGRITLMTVEKNKR